MGKHVDNAKKIQVLADIKGGTPVTEAAAKHAVNPTTVYAWLRQQADNTGTSSLEVAKLRRENAELKEIIGWFTLEKKRAEKNRGGA